MINLIADHEIKDKTTRKDLCSKYKDCDLDLYGLNELNTCTQILL